MKLFVFFQFLSPVWVREVAEIENKCFQFSIQKISSLLAISLIIQLFEIVNLPMIKFFNQIYEKLEYEFHLFSRYK